MERMSRSSWVASLLSSFAAASQRLTLTAICAAPRSVCAEADQLPEGHSRCGIAPLSSRLLPPLPSSLCPEPRVLQQNCNSAAARTAHSAAIRCGVTCQPN
eukprot:3756523-Rhodomonas_salina.1